ncbi:MAG: DUF1080 domain-containing protein [Bacteroidales bacterium]|nr:DUF1080 domain-containing protein [Bacteroidales bacterium]
MRALYNIIIILLVTTACTGRKSEKKQINKENIPVLDTTYIFNGRTLDGWEITNFGPQGPVEVSGGQIILGMGEGCTGITYKKKFPEINYEVSLEAMRITGNDFFCGMTFPVGKEYCTLIVGGWGGTVVGLSCIDGMDASENETTRLMSFENDRWYNIKVRTTEEKIEAWIDNEKVVDFSIGNKRLSLRPEVELSKPFGIASWCTTAAIKNIRLKLI